MSKFRKKPVVIEAFRFARGPEAETLPQWALDAVKEGTLKAATLAGDHECFSIKTLEGTMVAMLGDYIIQGVKGEIYPCKPDIFEATYEAVGE